MSNIRNYRELRVYQNAFESAMMIFELTKSFPAEEKYSMVDQMRRSSRSVCANLGEAWRKRRYRLILSVNFPIARAKRKKPEFGSNSLYPVSILINKFSTNLIQITI